ncbi:hypothetical protein EN871_24010 [bacterium M00.F.Ca.ET.228.01.1.1]|uniref:HrpD5 family protein n=1 Tax=Paraburkholderia phenoliruptrix TaxID=252970 RepID=UPI001092087C|nr:HrpD5 family protein [Paraburkholderia phenoliruptrix]TGP41519.1 hypothetical protein EN871_24010 [bacterium M00.F.Ca.ET.228.01.1.1]TGR98177.1 hypothetical protein EN834_23625 [bacterium M00.F.Ca.ET.191.01.1.1]TGU02368.1 hypothetical protein EN798_24445 [bacterium M00.F.Ca.ET.155.01.1.1]MBW0447171.1 hypothetical protein [Paraburkholderia phenoliruptrix]MBW9101446.1 hypothetical protein [Paraburkholderia phenoliruptrix]
MSKKIRVLTGFHAGAQIELSTTRMSIGAHPDSDILINDWSEGTMYLAIDTEDNLTIGMPGNLSSAVAMDDFVPQRFGDVVLCAGPLDAPWPSDLQLMEQMLTPRHEGRKYDGEESDGIFPAAPPVLMKSRHRAPWVHAGIAALVVGSMSAAAVVLPGGKASQAEDRPLFNATLADMQKALARLHQPDLAVARQAGGFIVSGVASSTADARAAHAALLALAGQRLNWNVKTGDEIAEALAESLHEPNVHVRYTGARRLAVSGTAQRPGTVREVVERFRGDIGPLIAGIDVDVARTDELGTAGDMDAALSADSVKYVESSDGTKNFVAEMPGSSTLH